MQLLEADLKALATLREYKIALIFSNLTLSRLIWGGIGSKTWELGGIISQGDVAFGAFPFCYSLTPPGPRAVEMIVTRTFDQRSANWNMITTYLPFLSTLIAITACWLNKLLKWSSPTNTTISLRTAIHVNQLRRLISLCSRRSKTFWPELYPRRLKTHVTGGGPRPPLWKMSSLSQASEKWQRNISQCGGC